MKTYYQELQDLHHRRVYYILLGGGLLMPLFSLLDWVIVSDLAGEFVVYRLLAVLAGLLLLVVNYRDCDKKYPLVTGFVGFLCVVLAILVMIHRMGGLSSPYYVGLILTMTIYAVLAPLTPWQTLISGFVPVFLYLITVQFTKAGYNNFFLEVFSNLFFMISFVFIVATQSWADTKARKHEFQLRVQENEAAKQLSGQAELLEAEVEMRSREQAASEKRHRLLFNQIADDVVFINHGGEILQSNENFVKHYAGVRSAVGMTLYDITLQRQHEVIRKLFAAMITTRKPITNHHLHLLQQDGTVTEAEMNGNLLLRDEVVVGILLVIRDISTRKEMERKLIQSLEIKKKTETAAILALAKLSEYRDVAAGNHLERVREYCCLLAHELSQHAELKEVMTSTYIEDIYHASILHDIGKVAIPDGLLFPDRVLLEHEKDLIRRHTIIGGDIIGEMEEENKGSGFLDMAKFIAYFHHERWDGQGYPYGLTKREIPLAARIMTLADTYEEMTAAIPEKPEASNHEEAKKFIVSNAGLRLDPMVVKAFLARQNEFRAIKEKYREN
jgi:PAS domain S-box-containing protein